jgi:O-antigen/teichoic acid export membrane protein
MNLVWPKKFDISFLKTATALSLAATMLKAGSGLVTLPLALRLIPQQEMGLYYTFWGMAGLVTVFDFGFAQSITRNASYIRGGARRLTATGVPEGGATLEDTNRLLVTLQRTGSLWYGASSLVLAGLLLIPGSAFVRDQMHTHGLDPIQASSWILLALAIVGNFYCSSLSALVMGLGKVREVSRATLAAQLVGLAVLLVALLLGFRLWSYALSHAVMAVAIFWINQRILHRHLPSPRVTAPVGWHDQKAMLAVLWPMVWRLGVVFAGAFLIQRTNTLICSHKLGLDATAQYGLTMALCGIIVQMCSIPVHIINPQILTLRVSGDIQGIKRIFFPRAYASLSCGVLAVAGLAALGQPLLTVLGSKTQLLPPSCILAMGAVWLLECHHGMYALLVLSENRNPFMIPAIASGIAVTVLSWCTIDAYGIWALILSQGLVQLCWNNWWTVWQGLQGLKKPLAP